MNIMKLGIKNDYNLYIKIDVHKLVLNHKIIEYEPCNVTNSILDYVNLIKIENYYQLCVQIIIMMISTIYKMNF